MENARFAPPAVLEPWRPPAFIKASVLLHGSSIALSAAEPALWPWAVATMLLNHAVVTVSGLWPRSTWLGPNLTRLSPEAARRGEVWITIDDGPDPELTPQVLEILAQHGARASFFCIGERAARHPEIVQRIVAAGHSVENHSERHLHSFSILGPKRMGEEVANAQRSLEAASGQRPRYFRAPAGLRNPFLDYVLHLQGLKLASWTRRGFDTRAQDAQRVLERLTRNLAGGDILLLHDGQCARGNKRPLILEVLPRLLTEIRARGLTTAIP